MTNLISFIATHWLLVGLFILAFIWLAIEEARHQGMGGARLSPQALTHMINQQEAVVVDLRDQSAFKDGHISSSINMPAADIERNLSKLEKYKQRPLIFVCAIGQKSIQIMHKMKKLGFEKVYILGGGLTAWKKADLPLKKT